MSVPTRKDELLAVALRIERDYGAGAAVHIAQKIGVAALQTDVEQIAFWKGVASQYERLPPHPATGQHLPLH